MVEGLALDEVWMFGSSARRESNEHSDVDVLAISDAVMLPATTVDRLHRIFGENLDIAHYNYRGLKILADQGSLFAWHLRHEGIPIFRKKNRLAEMLADMKPYTGHLDDLKVLATVLEEAMVSLPGRSAFYYDLGVVATVIRNVGIIMNNLVGKYDFSPIAPMRLSAVPDVPRFPISELDYAFLQSCRRATERGERIQGKQEACDSHVVVLEEVRQWLYDCIDYTNSRGGDSGIP